MFTDAIHTTPPGFDQIQQQSEAIGFSMPSDLYTGSLLQTLVATKPGARVLEIGTGTGLATAWLLAGMDAEASLVSIDTETAYQAIAEQILGHDPRLELRCEDAGTYLETATPGSFDLIFADAWPGKYSHLDVALALLAQGGGTSSTICCRNPTGLRVTPKKQINWWPIWKAAQTCTLPKWPGRRVF